MDRPSKLPLCCNQETVWVDNVPGKEYAFCRACRHEVGPAGGCQGCSMSRYPEYMRQGNRTFIEAAQEQIAAVHHSMGIDPSKLAQLQTLPAVAASGVAHPVHYMRTSGNHYVDPSKLDPACYYCGVDVITFMNLNRPKCPGRQPPPPPPVALRAYDTHLWPTGPHPTFNPQCRYCGVDMASFNGGPNAGPRCAPIVSAP